MDLEAAAAALEGAFPGPARALLVLGSGLGPLAGAVEGAIEVPFGEVPGLPATGVAGHAGRFVRGRLEGVEVLVQSGRHHAYEGRGPDVVAAPVRVAAALGVEILVVTNAAGGIRRDLVPGSLVVLDDQLNLTFGSPLIGPVRAGEPRFPDMSTPFDPGLQTMAEDAALEEGIRLVRGTYAGVKGPSFETPAEIRMIQRLGGDVVGMSTVPEVLVARALGLRVLGLSLVTNRAAGLGGGPLSHGEVMETAAEAGRRMEAVIRGVLRRLGR